MRRAWVTPRVRWARSFVRYERFQAQVSSCHHRTCVCVRLICRYLLYGWTWIGHALSFNPTLVSLSVTGFSGR